jgi:hypothetical protein
MSAAQFQRWRRAVMGREACRDGSLLPAAPIAVVRNRNLGNFERRSQKPMESKGRPQ